MKFSFSSIKFFIRANSFKKMDKKSLDKVSFKLNVSKIVIITFFIYFGIFLSAGVDAYSVESIGVCICDSCNDCTNALNDNINCFSRIKLNQSINQSSMVSYTCINNPTNFSNKIFDCQGHVMGSEVLGGKGIYLNNTQNITIKNCIIKNFGMGIYLFNSSNNAIINNTANLNGFFYKYGAGGHRVGPYPSSVGTGIRLEYSSNNNLINNTANSNTQYGIYLYFSSNNILKNNTFTNHTYNFNIYGDQISHYMQDIDRTNLVDNKPIFYWTNEKNAPNSCSNAEINESDNAGFAALISCDNITVKNLNLKNNSHGILMMSTINSKILHNGVNSNVYGISLFYSSNNALITNIVNSNNYGIYLNYSSTNMLTNNTAYSNNQYGIYLSSSSNNTLTNNTAYSNNQYGIYLYSSSNNTLTNNTADSNNYGIYLNYSSTNMLTNNTANLNYFGVRLDYSQNTTLTNNTANSNNYGLYLNSSSNNNLKNNKFENNSYNFNIYGSEISHYYQDIDTSNLVDYKPIYYWVDNTNALNCKNLEINESNNAGFVALIFCDNVTVKNLNLTKNSYGILLIDAFNTKILNNTINSNSYGIYSYRTNYGVTSYSTTNNNILCSNNLDFYSNDQWFLVNGTNNTCNRHGEWNDNSVSGCKFSCPQPIIHPNISLTKKVNTTLLRTGKNVTFYYTVTNTGDVPLMVGEVTDEYGELSCSSLSPPTNCTRNHLCESINCPKSDLSQGESTICECSTILDACGNITSDASVRAAVASSSYSIIMISAQTTMNHTIKCNSSCTNNIDCEENEFCNLSQCQMLFCLGNQILYNHTCINCTQYDFDNDTKADIFDVVAGLEFLSRNRSEIFNQECSDINNNGIDLTDLFALITKIVNG